MLLIDANILLEIILQQEKHEECEQFLYLVKEGQVKAIMSDFTVNSIILIMERSGSSPKDVRTFLLSLTKYIGLNIYPSMMPDKIYATKLMERYGLDYDDSLTLQIGIVNDCKEIVSFDKDFNKVKIIKRITPEEVLHNF